MIISGVPKTKEGPSYIGLTRLHELIDDLGPIQELHTFDKNVDELH